jgi:hypothetical protein
MGMFSSNKIITIEKSIFEKVDIFLVREWVISERGLERRRVMRFSRSSRDKSSNNNRTDPINRINLNPSNDNILFIPKIIPQRINSAS